MTIAAPKRLSRYTPEEFYALPDDGRAFELLDGELLEMPPGPGARHGDCTFLLGRHVGNFVEEHDLGVCFAAETAFEIASDPGTVLKPDFAFVTWDRLPKSAPVGALALAPDLVAETTSPWDQPRELMRKAEAWIRAGVRILWQLDPSARTVLVRRAGREDVILSAGDTLSGEDVLPGFTVPVASLFRDWRRGER